MPFVVPERPYQTPEWYKTMIEAWKELREGEFRGQFRAIPGTPYIIRSWQSGSVKCGTNRTNSRSRLSTSRDSKGASQAADLLR
jgi:hypothetical protein